MKRQLFTVLVCMTVFAVTSCGEKKGKDKFEERIEKAKESVEDVVDDAVTGYGYEFGNYAELEYILEMIGNNPQMIVDLKKNCIRKSVEYQPDKAIYPLIRRISNVE